MKRIEDKAYTKGENTEHRLIEHLRRMGRRIRPSEFFENMYDDIDAWEGNTSYSIKAQHTCLRTGNLAFELTVITANGLVYPGWYQHSKADRYLLVVGSNVYECSSAALRLYVEMNGFFREAHLTAATKASQQRINHPHIDATVGLIKISDLKDSGVLTWVCELPDEDVENEGHRGVVRTMAEHNTDGW